METRKDWGWPSSWPVKEQLIWGSTRLPLLPSSAQNLDIFHYAVEDYLVKLDYLAKPLIRKDPKQIQISHYFLDPMTSSPLLLISDSAVTHTQYKLPVERCVLLSDRAIT